MAHRQILLTDLKVGMYVIGVDRPWFHTSFLRHKFKIRDIADIECLGRSGITEVTIDTEQGVDLIDASEPISASAGRIDALSPSPLSIPAAPPSALVLADNLALAKQRRAEWMGRLHLLFEGTRATGLVSYPDVCRLVDEIIGVMFERQAACYAVISLRESDPTLYEHGLTVCTLSIILGHALGYSREALQQLGVGALLHDVGLIRLPRNLLKRTKTMTAAQAALYDGHPSQGVVMLEKSGVSDQTILSVLRSHHAVTEVSGSPDILQAGTEGPPRVVGIVDLYDELMTGQSGLPPMSASQAMTQLYQRYHRQQSLQESVAHLIRTLGVFPLYSLVALNSGELGVVGAITPGKAHLPTVYLFRDSQGRSCNPPLEVDLSQERKGGRVIHDVRNPRREGVDIESILLQVSA